MRVFLITGSLFGFLSVALGAFAAHALKSRLSPEMLAVFRTGVEYQFFHALAILLIASLCDRVPGVATPGWFFVVGIIIFSGSLYALALSDISFFGAITPLGGLSFLLGWALLVWKAL